MRCPIDNETLVMADRSGVEIDYCPKCRGVWLDRGELDKIIERAAAAPSIPQPAAPQVAPPPPPQPTYQQPAAYQPQVIPQPQQQPRSRRDDDDDYDDRGRKPHRKRESFLSDLFDF
jgi:Zn-finger nucleic acid-binding protein